MSSPSSRIVPVTRQPGIVSFMRLRQRRKVDLPQPDGPISAVTSFSVDVETDVVQRLLVAVEDAHLVGPESCMSLPAIGARRGAVRPSRATVACSSSTLPMRSMGHRRLPAAARSAGAAARPTGSSRSESQQHDDGAPRCARRTRAPARRPTGRSAPAAPSPDPAATRDVDDEGDHADHQQRRRLAERMRHADDGAGEHAGHGQRHARGGIPSASCEAPTPSAASRIEGGTAFSAARLAMMMVGSVISASTSPPTSGAERGRPKKLMNTARPEQAEDDRGHGRKVVDVDLDQIAVQRFFGANSSR